MADPHSQIPLSSPETAPAIVPILVGELAPVWWLVIVFGLTALAGAFAMRDRNDWDDPLDARAGNTAPNARALSFIGCGLIVAATLLLIYGE